MRPLSADRLIARGRSLACRYDVCLLPRLVDTQYTLGTRPPAFNITARRPLHDLFRSQFSHKCTHTHMQLAPLELSAGMKGTHPATIRGGTRRLRAPDDNFAAWGRPRKSSPASQHTMQCQCRPWHASMVRVACGRSLLRGVREHTGTRRALR